MSKTPKWKTRIIEELKALSNEELLEEAMSCSCQSCSKEETERPILAEKELKNRLIAIKFIRWRNL